MNMSYFTNGWNWCHLAYGFMLPILLVAIFRNNNPYLFVGLVFLSDMFKELLDSISQLYKVEWMWKLGFDPSGADVKDVIMCCVGILLALFVLGRL